VENYWNRNKEEIMQAVLTPMLRYEIRDLIDERIREKHVTREDFTELKDIVKELSIEVKEISSEIKELAEAQKGTQKEVGRLDKSMQELAEAQKETQKEMKEAQKEIKILAQAMNYTRRDLGGITSTLGYMLENEAYRVLPNMLKSKYGIEVKEKFLRRSIRSLGIKAEGEINIFSHGVYEDKGTEVVIIGEAKSQLGKDDIDDFLDLVAKLKKFGEGKRFLLLVTHYARETVVEYAKEKGVEVIQSFEW